MSDNLPTCVADKATAPPSTVGSNIVSIVGGGLGVLIGSNIPDRVREWWEASGDVSCAVKALVYFRKELPVLPDEDPSVPREIRERVDGFQEKAEK